VVPHYMLMSGGGLKSLGSAEVERVSALNLWSF
jgi:hypothetical protein